jgi:rfaE bifunctional protein nucleotidyltransferase chain/domain
VVQCHGCFDLLHIGHIRHFQAAKRAGDMLVVTVTPDEYVKKGPGRPVFTAQQRAEAVGSLSCVDAVVITREPTAAAAIRSIRPAVFAKGLDYSAETLDRGELEALKDVGAELLITQTEKWSSTALLQHLTPEVGRYLSGIRLQYSAADVLGWLEKARSLKVLVIGDAIRDEYHYVDTLGKSGKDPILAAQFVKAESFVGGAEAVARHVGACVDAVSCVTGPVTVKRRFIERYPFQKLFEVYDTDPTVPVSTARTNVAAYDVVIVADYGHGLLSPAAIEEICASAPFVAVNVQANAGNHGFSTISKYPRADFISLSERELRLDARDQQSDVQQLAIKASLTHGGRVLVTRGEKGCMGVYAGDYADAPALTTHTVDRTGAGDAVFAITACCAAVGFRMFVV